MNEWAASDEISDRIIELMNSRLEQGVGPIQLLAGQLLGLLGFMRTAPQQNRPATFTAVEAAVTACLEDLLHG